VRTFSSRRTTRTMISTSTVRHADRAWVRAGQRSTAAHIQSSETKRHAKALRTDSASQRPMVTPVWPRAPTRFPAAVWLPKQESFLYANCLACVVPRTDSVQGIHNIFVVTPQFLVTGLSSLIFALFEPAKSVLHGSHPGKTLPPAGANGTLPDAAADAAAGIAEAGVKLLLRAADVLDVAADDERVDGVNSVAVIFRIGGAAAVVACVLTWRLAKDMKRA
jgi:hypothetical protein